jgi:Na+-driven multidrug efflux pump
VIIKKLPILKIGRKDFVFTKAEFWEHLRVALPTGFQMSIVAIGSVTVTFALNRLGPIALAANTAGGKIDALANMPINSFGSAITTYAAQNYGARKYPRIKQGMIQCFLMSGGFGLVMGGLYWIFGRQLCALFVGNDATQVVDLSYLWLRIQGSGYVLLSWLFATRQTLQGLGKSTITTLSGIAELVMRMVAALALSVPFGFTGVCFANMLAWGGACIPLSIVIVFTLKKLKNMS